MGRRLSVSPFHSPFASSRLLVSRELRAFTLIELMLSIALVLLLMLGVNSIFKTTSDAVGAGQRLGDATRGQQALQSVFTQDFAAALQDPPLFWITSEQVYMYTNWDDYRSNAQGDDPENVDLNANGIRGENAVPGEDVPTYVLNYRSHRVDTMGFFARGNFRRNTGNAGQGVSPTTSSDAFIWYGHARLPNKAFTTYWGPNDPPWGTNKLGNPSSWYGVFAAEWVLARQVMLLRDPNTLSAGEHHYPRRGTAPQSYFVNNTPLQFQNLATDNTARLQEARFDLLGASLEDLRGIVQNAIASEGAVQAQAIADGLPQLLVKWWHAVLFNVPQYTGSLPNNSTYGPYAKNDMDNPRVLRFHSDPIIMKPLTADNAARVINQLTQGVSQFAIEYAGDFLVQDRNGIPLGAGQDGVIDFIGLDNDNNDMIDERCIRWYGLPRDVDGDGVIRGWQQKYPKTVAGLSALRDVIPLRDLICVANEADDNEHTNVNNRAAFEVEVRIDPKADYGTVNAGNINAPPRYLCVWVNDTPAMIRILTKVDDPNNRLKDGPWQEMVFTLKR